MRLTNPGSSTCNPDRHSVNSAHNREVDRWGKYLPPPKKQPRRWPLVSAAAIAHDRMALFYKGSGCERNFPRVQVTPASREDLQAEIERQKPPRDSRYHGVLLARHVQQRRWQTMVYGPNRKTCFCGMWDSEQTAAVAHDRVALHLFSGHPPVLNFPKRALEPMSPTQMRREAVRQRKKSNSSRYLGIYFSKGAWTAAITLRDGRPQYVGRFEDEEEAALARDREARKYSGPRTKFNFPRPGER